MGGSTTIMSRRRRNKNTDNGSSTAAPPWNGGEPTVLPCKEPPDPGKHFALQDYSSDEKTIVTSNCSQHYSTTEGAGEGVLKSQSRVTRIPGLSSLVSFATPSGHNIS